VNMTHELLQGWQFRAELPNASGRHSEMQVIPSTAKKLRHSYGDRNGHITDALAIWNRHELEMCSYADLST